jgi:hypothetical protein
MTNPGQTSATLGKLDLRLAVEEDVIGDYPVKIKCLAPEHKDKVRSLAVYSEHLHCFGCGLHLDLWEGAAPMPKDHVHPLAYLLGVSNDEALKVAPRYANDTLDAYRERAATEARRDPMPGSLALIYNEILLEGRRRERANWLKARGLTVATIHGNYLGHDGVRFTIPVFDSRGNLISIRYRRDDAYCDETTPKYSGTKGRNGLYLYPENLLAKDTRDWVVLCEGELDALRLWQEDVPAATATNGAGQSAKLPAILKAQYPRIKRIVVATDMDEPGREAAEVTVAAAIKEGYQAFALEWLQGKDVTEALQLRALNLRALKQEFA